MHSPILQYRRKPIYLLPYRALNNSTVHYYTYLTWRRLRTIYWWILSLLLSKYRPIYFSLFIRPVFSYSSIFSLEVSFNFYLKIFKRWTTYQKGFSTFCSIPRWRTCQLFHPYNPNGSHFKVAWPKHNITITAPRIDNVSILSAPVNLRKLR